MNLQLGDCEEYVEGALEGKLGEVLIRCARGQLPRGPATLGLCRVPAWPASAGSFADAGRSHAAAATNVSPETRSLPVIA